MNWRKWNNIIHRDLGYFLIGLTVIYAISGFATNHMETWDSNFVIEENRFRIDNITVETPVDHALIDMVLKTTGEMENYNNHFRPAPGQLKVFVTGGIIDVDMATGEAVVERRKRRPIFRALNYLHLNHAKGAWTYAADFYAVGLFLLAITGLFVLKGKKGLKGRGKWFVIAGVVVPIVFLLIYF